jgi:hypothetical protein
MALVIVIVAEMFIGSDSGLGHRIIDAQQVLNVKSMYAAILAAGALGYALNILFLVAERKIVHWSGGRRERPQRAGRRRRAARRRSRRAGRNAHHDPRPDQVLRRLAALRELRPRHPKAGSSRCSGRTAAASRRSST